MDDTQLIDGLKRLCGYVENGTDRSVTIFQDDATREWMVRVGKQWPSHGNSMRQALEAAIQEFGEEEHG